MNGNDLVSRKNVLRRSPLVPSAQDNLVRMLHGMFGQLTIANKFTCSQGQGQFQAQLPEFLAVMKHKGFKRTVLKYS